MSILYNKVVIHNTMGEFDKMKKYDVAAFVWPAYTGNDKRAKIFWDEGIGEWQTLKNAKPENNGETWPRKPLWGYENEADPHVMERQIDAALEHGINTFIYDWYWYDKRPFLENCLNDGFLKAANNKKMKFYLMWANHNATYLWDIRNSHDTSVPVWEGAVDRREFERIARRLTEKYFLLENYYKIDEEPVFMIYDFNNLSKGLGGFSGVKEAFAWFSEMVKEYGLPGVHFQYVKFGNVPIESAMEEGYKLSPTEAILKVGFKSMSHYQFVHFMSMKNMTYEKAIELMKKEWEICDSNDIIYFPHVSIGWDANIRFKRYDSNILRNNTPENVEKAFRLAKEYADAHGEQPPLITVNSWNEWTEGSYLEPDDINGYGYLEAARRVFYKTQEGE